MLATHGGVQQEGGAAAGLAFPQVSAYALLAAGPYDLRLVVAGSGGCSVPLIPDLTSLASLAGGSATTLAFVGEFNPSGGDPGLQVVRFSDDSTPVAGSLALRFVQAAAGLRSVDFGTGNSTTFQAVVSGVTFGQDPTKEKTAVSDGGPRFDSLGYWVRGAMLGQTLSARPTGSTTVEIVAPTISVAVGSILTVVLVGGTSAGAPAQLLACVDNAGTTSLYSNCNIISSP
jgi:hypothetical protein